MLGASLHPFVVVVAAAFFVVGFPTWRLCGSRERGLERYTVGRILNNLVQGICSLMF